MLFPKENELPFVAVKLTVMVDPAQTGLGVTLVTCKDWASKPFIKKLEIKNTLPNSTAL